MGFIHGTITKSVVLADVLTIASNRPFEEARTSTRNDNETFTSLCARHSITEMDKTMNKAPTLTRIRLVENKREKVSRSGTGECTQYIPVASEDAVVFARGIVVTDFTGNISEDST
jgi:hypothetical protein